MSCARDCRRGRDHARGRRGADGQQRRPGASARFYYPQGIGMDAAHNLYLTDTSNNTVRKITPAGMVTTTAGMTGRRGFVDGPPGISGLPATAGLPCPATGQSISPRPTPCAGSRPTARYQHWPDRGSARRMARGPMPRSSTWEPSRATARETFMLQTRESSRSW